MSNIQRQRINAPLGNTLLCISVTLLLGTQAHSFEQSSYALFRIVEDDSVAAVDGGRLPIHRSVFQSAESEGSSTVEAPAATNDVRLDFTKSSFGNESTGFGSSFGDLSTDTLQFEESESFDLGEFGTNR
jgi:hypothetical protein